MTLKRLLRRSFILLISYFLLQTIQAQICVDDYFFVNFTTLSVQKPVSTIAAGGNEILMLGSAQRYNSLLEGGWLTRFSAQGTVLWSKLFYTGIPNFVNFTNIIPAGNDNYLITGNVGDVDTSVWPLAHLTEYGLILKVDKYGNVIWSKILSNIIRPFASSDITSIDATKDGDFVLSLDYFTTTQYRVVVRMDADGNVKWTTLISSPSRNTGFGDIKLRILEDGNIALSEYATVLDDDHPYRRQGYYFSCLNGASGDRMWGHMFLRTDTLSFANKAFSDVINVSELPDHSLSFIASHADVSVNSYLRKTDQVLNFVTDHSGILKKVISYTSFVTPLYASSVAENGNGNKAILMDNGDSTFMMNINSNGDILWQQGYAGTGRSQETKCALSNDYGFYFVSITNNGGSRNPKLVKTDMQGNAPCVQTSFSATAKDIFSSYMMQNVNMVFEKGSATWGDIRVGVYDYSVKGNNACRIACCSDVTDTAAPLDLCDVEAYTLPNNDVVKNSGTYAVTYKTTKGCDSIVYYSINLSFTPKASLGADTCFGTRDSVILKTEPGYPMYTWNGITTNSPIYVARQEGVYTVSAGNRCGIKTDTVQVLKSCEFDIYMPNAFTPNGDGLNDVFRVPPQNYNRLVSLTVYNRWGQKIFATKNMGEGWNGMHGAYQAATGTYIYIVVMQSLDRKKIFTKQGYVTLIR